jgi:nitrogen fixation protein FixH
MWMLSFLPDSFLLFIVNTILVLGIVSSFLTFFVLHRIVRFFPVLINYHLILQIVSAVLLILGVYLKGGYSVEKKWRDRVAELEAKIAVAEEKAKVVNEKVVVEYRDRVRVVKDTQVVIQEQIKEVEKVINEQCTLAEEVIKIHNLAAGTNKGDKK